MRKKKELYDYSAFEKPGLKALIVTLKQIGFKVETDPKFERGMWRFKVSRDNWS
jgi:hypothetical protein